jgi:hypothetical protein
VPHGPGGLPGRPTAERALDRLTLGGAPSVPARCCQRCRSGYEQLPFPSLAVEVAPRQILDSRGRQSREWATSIARSRPTAPGGRLRRRGQLRPRYQSRKRSGGAYGDAPASSLLELAQSLGLVTLDESPGGISASAESSNATPRGPKRLAFGSPCNAQFMSADQNPWSDREAGGRPQDRRRSTPGEHRTERRSIMEA